ncbi:Trans-aconitate 2-methyltransferase (plasmid) [Pseudoseohaeicola sp. NH-UV-7]|uniref:methyltransferase domain-containing protein n=1 Tax=Sulfitobacter sp. TBRI5 TaxID=2989732 RepID=UPI003A782461
MNEERITDWNPETYDRFRGFRFRPPMDLLHTLGALPEGDIVDLGCGAGVVGKALALRYPDHRLIGVDNSPAMLARAEQTADYTDLVRADIAKWQPREPVALIFSNAALQWIGSHADVLMRLVSGLKPAGVLAVQMPHQNAAPSHRMWSHCFARLFPKRPLPATPGILAPQDYADLLSPSGDFQTWETDYYQVLPASRQGHPVRLFTESTFARPFLDGLNGADQKALINAYDAEMETAYPARNDGCVTFVFRRLFFTLTVHA